MSAQGTEAIRQFFDGQDVYSIVIRENYMKHRETLQWLLDRFGPDNATGLRILEVGCGDAWVVSQFAQHVPVQKYVGIDLAENSLRRAQKFLEPHVEQVVLIQGDYVDKVGDLTETFDLIIAGFVIHHLQTTEKHAAIRMLKEKLKPQGSLLIYDVTRSGGESRDEFNARSLNYYDAHWTSLTSAQLLAIREHVTTYDFPESSEKWIELGVENGLRLESKGYLDEAGFYGIMELKNG